MHDMPDASTRYVIDWLQASEGVYGFYLEEATHRAALGRLEGDYSELEHWVGYIRHFEPHENVGQRTCELAEKITDEELGLVDWKAVADALLEGGGS